MMKIAVSSASVANVVTRFMMCAMFNTAPLFYGIVDSFDKKKFPPARLLAFGSLK